MKTPQIEKLEVGAVIDVGPLCSAVAPYEPVKLIVKKQKLEETVFEVRYFGALMGLVKYREGKWGELA